MIDTLKQKMMTKGMELLQSPMVGKVMANEKVGIAIQKAMNVPFAVTGAVSSQKEKLVALFDLATQQDIDDIRRAMNRVEGALQDIKQESADLLTKVNKGKP